MSEMIEILDKQLAAAGISFDPSRVARAEIPPFIYDGHSMTYYYLATNGSYNSMTEQSLRIRLADMGFSSAKMDTPVSEVDRLVVRIQNERVVVCAGPFAGYKSGVRAVGGYGNVLVTRDHRPVTPHPGEFSLIKGILEQALTGEGCDQLPYFYGHLQTFLRSYLKVYETGDFQAMLPGQVLVLAGQAGSGKTLIKKLLIGLVGGTSGRPFQFMEGGTGFNADLVGAPWLEIDDEAASRDPRMRSRLGAKMKEMTVSEGVRVHPKGKDAFMAKVCQRMIVCVNDEPESLLVLPPLERSIADKLMLFSVNRVTMPMPTGSPEVRSAFWTALEAEIPAFAHYLIHEYAIPDELQCTRYGIKHYHHPDLLSALDDTSPQGRILEVIDTLFQTGSLFTGRNPQANHRDLGENKMGESALLTALPKEWIGTAAELERIIRNDLGIAEASQLFRHANSAGMMLRSLANHHPHRVVSAGKTNGYHKWRILAEK